MAFAGTTNERNTTVSRMNDNSNTTMMISGVYVSEISKKSFTKALSPPTSTSASVSAKAAGR